MHMTNDMSCTLCDSSPSTTCKHQFDKLNITQVILNDRLKMQIRHAQPADLSIKQLVKLASQAKQKKDLFLLRHIMTRNLNKKRPVAMEIKDISEYRYPNAVYYFPEQSCVSCIKDQFRNLNPLRDSWRLRKISLALVWKLKSLLGFSGIKEKIKLISTPQVLRNPKGI